MGTYCKWMIKNKKPTIVFFMQPNTCWWKHILSCLKWPLFPSKHTSEWLLLFIKCSLFASRNHFFPYKFPCVHVTDVRARCRGFTPHHWWVWSAGSQQGQKLWYGWMAERRSWGTIVTLSLLSACDLSEPCICDLSLCLFQEARQSRRDETVGDDLFRWETDFL